MEGIHKLSVVALREGDSGDGEKGTPPEPGDRKGNWRNSEPLEGERDSDRRISRMAE